MIWILVALLAQDAAELKRAVEEGLAARKSGDRAAAVRAFEKVARLAPGMAAAHMNLGAAYFDRHDYAKAIPSLERALELNPELPGAHLLLGRALLEEGRPRDAIHHLEAASQGGADHPDVLFFLTKAHAALSEQLAQRLLDVAPDSARAHQFRAEASRAAGKFAEAEAAYRAALSKEPQLAGIRLGLAELFLEAADVERAAKELEEELRTDPDSAAALYRLGTILTDRGDLEAALRTLRRADSLRPDMPETLFALGRAEALAGSLEAADAHLRRVIELEGRSALAKSAHYQRAQILQRLGRAAEAREELRKFRAIP